MNTILRTRGGRQDDPPLTTTLYELIEAIQDEASPYADDLVVASVMELLQHSRIAFLRRGLYLQPFRPTLEGMSYS
jgi:hypothetical protein